MGFFISAALEEQKSVLEKSPPPKIRGIWLIDGKWTSRFCLYIIENEPAVRPADQEEAVQRHAEVLVVHIRDVLDVDPCGGEIS